MSNHTPKGCQGSGTNVPSQEALSTPPFPLVLPYASQGTGAGKQL